MNEDKQHTSRSNKRFSLSGTKIAFEDKLVKILLWGSIAPILISLGFIINSEVSVYLKVLLMFIICMATAFTAFSIRQQVIFQLRTSTNLVEAMISGDYGLRANNKDIDGALSDFNKLLNGLAQRLAQQSLITREKQILLSKITNQIDVAIVACDHNKNISLMNPTAERLFKKRFESVQGWPISTIGLHKVIERTAGTTQEIDSTSSSQTQSFNTVTEFEINRDKRKVYVRSDTYLELGKLQHLIFITDIQQLLRDEERQAWQKLLRVLSHEINNSLTPIASISETLTQIVQTQANQQAFDQQTTQNINEGLAVITERAHSLNHFIQDYQQLTRLPAPTKSVFDLRALLLKISQLFDESIISMPKDSLNVYADSEQLQQVFVNLLKNAQEANVANKDRPSEISSISVKWHQEHELLHIEIIDQGTGINNTDNLFVPFYTTKKQGSGIGLTLSRQIALNHGGDLRLINHKTPNTEIALGAIARLTLPNPIKV